MKNKILNIILLLTVFTFAGLFGMKSVKAADTYSAIFPRLVDVADVLTDAEEERLLEKLNYLSEKYEFDIIITTVRDADYSNIKSYAEEIFDLNGYGFDHGEEYDNTGIILVMDFGKREWAISKSGEAEENIYDKTTDEMADYFLPYLSHGEMYKGFDAFADLSEEVIVAMRSGNEPKFVAKDDLPEAKHTVEDGKKKTMMRYGIAVAVGLVLAFGLVMMLTSQLNNVIPVGHASNYEVEGSFVLTEKGDHFLYRTVTKQKIEKNNSSSSGGSRGGSSGKF